MDGGEQPANLLAPCHFFDWMKIIVGFVGGLIGIAVGRYLFTGYVKPRDRVIKMQADLEKMSNEEEKEELKREMKRMVRAFNELVGIYDNIDGAFWLKRRTVWKAYSFLMNEGTSLLCRPDARSFQLATNRLRWKANKLRKEYEQELGPPLSPEIPKIGFGTFIRDNMQCRASVQSALEAGYRHFECAFGYGNQQTVGEAIKEAITNGTVKREDLFITSKVGNEFHSYDMCLRNVDTILAQMQLTYLDACLIHWPFGYLEGGTILSEVDYLETWAALETCVKDGKIRFIGLSNFNRQQVERVIGNCAIKPTALEIELHPFFQQQELVEYCHSRGIKVIACSPFGSIRRDNLPNVFDDRVITGIASHHHKSNAQVTLQFLLQRYGVCVIPMSVKAVHIQENLNTLEGAGFILSEEELRQMKLLHRSGGRAILAKCEAVHKYYPF